MPRFIILCVLLLVPVAAWFAPGLGLYLAGSAVYFGSWLLMMHGNDAVLSSRPLLQLAPAYTPLLLFAGIAAMTESPLYLAGSALFVPFHTLEYVSTAIR